MNINAFKNTITALVRLSSLSKSGLLIPPSLISALDDLVKEEFAAWRDMWFDCLLVATAIVFVGLALEGPELYHEIRHLWLDRRDEKHFLVLTDHKIKPRWKLLAFAGWILIVAGVAGEGFFETMVSLADGNLQTFNDIILDSTTREAGSAAASAKTAHDEADAVKGIADEARADAKDALAKSQAAQRELAHAEANAVKAQAAASKALSTADKAESHLAEAMKRADALTAQLDRLTTPRSLPHSPQVIASLKPFNHTEYMFTEVCGDTECINLLKDIDSVLGLAGWKRIKSPHRFPGLVLWGDPKDGDGAGIALEPGIKVSIESQDPDIDKRSIADLPQYIRAALLLNLTLGSNVTPSENTGRLVEKQSGASTAVRISVGRKPIP